MIRRRALAALLVFAALAAVAALLATSGRADRHGARVVTFTIRSHAVGHSLRVVGVVPRGQTDVTHPLLVFLHGKGARPDSYLSDSFFGGLAELGKDAPVVVFPSGGDGSYWHDRASGRWGRYVLKEVIPAAIKRFHADPKRIAIGGVSMGGFGAYDVARRAPGRFCAVGGHSAAVFFSAGGSAPGAFDDPGDFARHDVLAAARHHTRRALYRSAELWLDTGRDDPFRSADAALARALHTPLHVRRGGHMDSYWRRNFPTYLRFYAHALTRC